MYVKYSIFVLFVIICAAPKPKNVKQDQRNIATVERRRLLLWERPYEMRTCDDGQEMNDD